FSGWLDFYSDGARSKPISDKIREKLSETDLGGSPILSEISEKQAYLDKRSVWMIGGDGWAYDIGYGGLDHVISCGGDVNIFVLDTEVYSNTGGQLSKSTPAGAVAKFAFEGKKTAKKDLGLMAMTYKNVYIAQIAMGADMNQTIKAVTEAESYPGPSLIIAYSPCISHGIKNGMSSSMLEEKRAVESGYWQLYRYDPRLIKDGKNPFILDSKKPSIPYRDFLSGELRFSQLKPELSETLFKDSEADAAKRLETYQKLSKNI
ncbi:MAG: thiamine pyrophosphate-dependent enzyme, partial [Bacillota bacterium]|nr:thiamine pyrophosphate-dependent enzyme [Bacillota bacterium]